MRRAGSEILTQEVFGPVLTLQTFTTEDEAIALANDTDYGLAAIVYTGDPARAERVSERLVAGTVWVNCFFVRDLSAPFGGSTQLGHRPRGRDVELRLLRGRQERVHRTVERERGERATWVRSSARPWSRTSPRSCCRKRPGWRSTTARRSRWCPGLRRLKSECLDRVNADTVIVFDTHWESTFEHIVTSAERRTGKFTSHELPRGMAQVPYDMPGDPELARSSRRRPTGATTAGSWPATTRTCRSSTAR